jgi:hypothetical protein
LPDQRCTEIWHQREVSPTLYRPIRDHWDMWTSRLSYSTSGSILGCAQCVSCDIVEERCGSTRDRSDHGSECLDRARSFSGRASAESARSKRKAKLGDIPGRCTRYNGVTILKKKLRGRPSTSSTPSIRVFFNRETVRTLPYLCLWISNLGSRFLLRG